MPATLPASAAVAWTPERIRKLRKRLKWTQEQMAEALGYDRVISVGDLENDRTKPSGAVGVLLDLIDAHDGLPSRDRH